nr:hypothetical protein [Pandoravirus aubagnensis]
MTALSLPMQNKAHGATTRAPLSQTARALWCAPARKRNGREGEKKACAIESDPSVLAKGRPLEATNACPEHPFFVPFFSLFLLFTCVGPTRLPAHLFFRQP